MDAHLALPESGAGPGIVVAMEVFALARAGRPRVGADPGVPAAHAADGGLTTEGAPRDALEPIS